MRYGNTPETREALVYARLHADRDSHLDAARRARATQATLAEARIQARARIARHKRFELLAGIATAMALVLALESFAVVVFTLNLAFK